MERSDQRRGRQSLDYSIGIGISDNTSEITKYDNPTLSLDETHYQGKKIGEIWGYVTERYYTIDDFQDGWQNGIWKLKDGVTTIKGNNNIRPGDIMYKNLRDDPDNERCKSNR